MSSKKEVYKTEVITLTARDRMADSLLKLPPCLVLVSGDAGSVGRQWNLDKPITTLGRTAESDIHLSEGGLSKTHAQFSRDGENVAVTDLGSTNKTIVNGVTLIPNQPQALKNNDLVQAGALFFKFLQKGIVSETAEKARMQAELESARNVQARVLPSQAEAVYGTVRVGGRYRPASETGGDWWWHWSAGEKAFLIVGDTTGHGVGAALMTSAARSAVSTLEHDDTIDIEKVYETLSRALHTCANGDIVMSAFIVEFETKTGRMRFVNASHVPSVLVPPGLKDLSTLTIVDCQASPPLGSPPSAGSLTVASVDIRPGSRFILLTDGLTERKKSTGQMMREKEFFNMLVAVHLASPTDQARFLNLLMERSDAQACGVALEDDITVAVMDFY